MSNNENPIKSGFEQDAQQVKERKPDPMSKTTENNLMLEYAEKLSSFISVNNLTQTKVAKMMGVSTSVISQFLKAEYNGDVQSVIGKVVELINSVDRRSRKQGKGYVDTSIAREIATLINNVDAYCLEDEGCIGVIIGDSGHGKSICLREFAKANQSTFYIQLYDAMTIRDVFAEIGKAIGTSESGLKSVTTGRIIDKLHERHVIIILDEASSLNVGELNQLRQVIVDRSVCPLILAGNADLLKTIESGRTRRGYESLDQFQSRMLKVLNLDELAASPDGGLYTADDIRKLYEYNGIRLAKDAVDTLRKICHVAQTGRLRTCSKIITALHTCLDEGSEITGQLIESAIYELHLPVQRHLPVIRSRNIKSKQETQNQQIAAAG